ncbi:hypothetical protein Tco_0699878 [Tanacetum coccineum]
MKSQNALLKDERCKDVDVHMYRSMIGSLMYLTSSRPDIKICRMSQSTISSQSKSFTSSCCEKGYIMLMLPSINLLLLLKVNAARHNLLLLLKVNAVDALVDWEEEIITGSTGEEIVQLEDAKGVDCVGSTQRPRKPKRKDTEIPQSSGLTDNVANEAVNEEMDDSLERAATIATSLDVEQDRGNINKTQSKATPNEASSQGTTSSGGPRCQETMGDTIAQTRFENVSKTSNDLLLARGNTLRSGEDSLKLNELMELCTNLQQRVLDLETTKTTQANEIASLKRRVKKLERSNKSRTHGLKRMYRVGSSRRVESSEDEGLGEEDASKQGRRINVIESDEDITLVNDQDDADMFDVNDLDGAEVIVDNVDVVTTVSTASTITVSVAIATTTTTATITDVEVTLAQALAELKSAKPKAVKVVIQEPEQGTTTTTPTTIIFIPKPPQDKGKGIMIEEHVVEQVKPMKRLEQIRLDEELAFKLQAREKEEERLAREKAHQTKEDNIAWDDVQAKIKVDY